MRSFRLLYDEWLHRRPLLTKMVTSSVLFGIGDRLSQRVERIGKTDQELEAMAEDNVVEEGRLLSESTAKTVRMMVWGGLFLSPIMHNWYNLMEHVFVGTGKVVAAKKVVADMVFLAPQMPIWFFTTTGAMAGKPYGQALDNAIEKQPVYAYGQLHAVARSQLHHVRRDAAPVQTPVRQLCERRVGFRPVVHGHSPASSTPVPTVFEAHPHVRRPSAA